jgi:recombination protein RecT
MNAENPVAIVCRAITTPDMQAKFKAVLPADVSLDRFTRVTLMAIQKNPAVLECDRSSLYNSCVDAAARGLMPDGKEGAIVSFRQKDGPPKAQFMPMPEGIIKEMAKAGVKAHAVSVYEKDTVDVWNDDAGQHFSHRPVVFGSRGERIGAVAWATDRDGRTYVEAMNMEDLLRVAQSSRSKNKAGEIVGPWAQWPERMEQKSALHRLRKRIAILGAEDVVQRLQEDEEQDFEPATAPAEAAPAPAAEAPAQKRPRGLQAVVEAAKAPIRQPEPEPQDDYAEYSQDNGEIF